LAAKKVTVKNLKKQRWAVIVAAVLALGMIVSLVGSFIIQAVGGGDPLLPEQQINQQAEPQPEDYLDYYRSEVERLDEYLAGNEPTEAILLEQINNYRYLGFIQQMFFEDEEAFESSQESISSLLDTLVEIAPGNAEYRYELIGNYIDTGADEEAIKTEIVVLLDLLHEEFNPRVHLALVNLLASNGYEEMVVAEVEWLENLLNAKYESGEADNEESFYYALLIGEYLEKRDDAMKILKEILQDEPEDSMIYQDAASYLDYLETDSAEVEELPDQ
jgi:hypothetical protein